MRCSTGKGPAFLLAGLLRGDPPHSVTATERKAHNVIAPAPVRTTLAAYLTAHSDAVSTSAVRVARVSDGSKVHLVGVGALLGAGRSPRKARASQQNGRLGGWP